MPTQNNLFLYLNAVAANDDGECLRTNTVILPWCLSITWISMCSLEAELGLCDKISEILIVDKYHVFP